MGKRFDTLIFPGGKSKACTFSYDDGVVQDRRLTKIFRDRGLVCSFNIGSGLLGHSDFGGFPGKPDLDISKVSAEEVPELYAGHEIAGHGLYHSPLNAVGTPLATYEIIEDKRRLEQLSGRPLRMFAYPFGTYNAEVKEILRMAGYQGARTVKSTGSFAIPEDFLEWNPTCHHNDPRLMELAKEFVEGVPRNPMLFYVWGHAYEFDDCKNWERIEELADFLAGYHDRIWFASNGEIMEYVTAYRRLEYSADGSMIYNPSAVDVLIRTDFATVVVLKGGEVTRIRETAL